MKKRDVVSYIPPRRDSWLAKLSDDARLEVLSLRKRMSWEEALAYIKEKYGIDVSRSAYFAALKRFATNEIAAIQLKAASVPPALDYLVEITETLKSIDRSLKKMLPKRKNQEESST